MPRKLTVDNIKKGRSYAVTVGRRVYIGEYTGTIPADPNKTGYARRERIILRGHSIIEYICTDEIVEIHSAVSNTP